MRININLFLLVSSPVTISKWDKMLKVWVSQYYVIKVIKFIFYIIFNIIEWLNYVNSLKVYRYVHIHISSGLYIMGSHFRK